MTSTLIGSAAPTTGDLVATTNPAGETLIGFILRVLVTGGRIRPVTTYEVRVGSGRGSHRTWNAERCTYTTPELAARRLTAGQPVHTMVRGDWHEATVTSVGRTRVAVTRPDHNHGRPFTVPAWQAMTVAG